MYCKLCLATDIRMSKMNSTICKAYSNLLELKIEEAMVKNIDRKQFKLESKLSLCNSMVQLQVPEDSDNEQLDVKNEEENRDVQIGNTKLKFEYQEVKQEDTIILKKENKDEQIETVRDDSDTELIECMSSSDEYDINDKPENIKRSSKITFNDRVINCGNLAEISLYVSKDDLTKNVEHVLPAANRTINNDYPKIKLISPGRQYVNKFNSNLYKDYITMVTMTNDEAEMEMALRKESKNYIKSPLKCDLCYKGFSSNNAYENHMKKHTVNRPLECVYCHMKFTRNPPLNAHIKKSHTYKFMCKICPFINYHPDIAMAHADIHKNVKPYACDKCDETFNVARILKTHQVAKHSLDAVELVCDLCGSIFKTECGIRVHKNIIHIGIKEINEAKGPKCEECGVQFATETAWKRHLVLSTKHEVSNGCEFCGETFTSAIDLKYHLKQNHPDRSRRTVPIGLRSISSKMHRKAEYKSQIKSKDPEDPVFICEVCGHYCKNKHRFFEHRNIHTGERPFKCKECGKGYHNLTSLYMHRNIHKGKKYQCDTCQKVFVSKFTLKRHIRIHLGIRPHKCHICDKTFVHACEVKYHIKHSHNKVPWPKPNGKRSAKVRAILKARAGRQAAAGASDTRANV